jgi:acetyl esterase/lipase
MHRVLRAAGVEAHLHVYDGQAHGDYMLGSVIPFPESNDALRELGEFFDKHINR